MSIKAMTWAMQEAPVEDAGPAHVLLILADHANDDGTGAFPSVDTIVWKTRMGERTVQRHLRTLEEQGLIRKGNQKLAELYIEREDRRPTVYDLDLARCRPPRERGANLTPRSSASSTDGVPNSTERGANLAPEPSFEPSGKKNQPPTPQSAAAEVADAPGQVGHQVLQEEAKDAAAGGAEYASAVAAITSHMQWQPQASTQRKLTDILHTLVPDLQQLPDVVDRSSGWIARPERLSSGAFRGRIRTLKKQIDSGVTPLHRKGLNRSPASPEGHEDVSSDLKYGW
ncbi:helix-turn-helix domain-containing protein [Streptomyces ortus]|uniref:Helix-turn-helix domain-containing protein n=1 Tax=Streptomyces ortus TaxID=2867268 RepID=A0ABT3UZ00_9ACTN|nr:helix-turn-helix domain-containing protein [Streptomyces ortus]MCX4232822.1 helix-turn-helix domain-containing protein [Streptomyces ortus]